MFAVAHDARPPGGSYQDDLDERGAEVLRACALEALRQVAAQSAGARRLVDELEARHQRGTG